MMNVMHFVVILLIRENRFFYPYLPFKFYINPSTKALIIYKVYCLILCLSLIMIDLCLIM